MTVADQVQAVFSRSRVQVATSNRVIGAKWGLAVLLVVYLMLGTTYSMLTPAWEAPDEPAHAAYVRHLHFERTLPVMQEGVLGAAQHPPLYYLLAALVSAPADLSIGTAPFTPNTDFVWAGQGGQAPNISLHFTAETFPYRGEALFLHLARLTSVVMGLGTVLFTVLLGWQIFPGRRMIGLLAGALVAFNPQFLFISGSISNDNLLNLTVTAAFWLVARALQEPEEWRRWAWVGVALALALLSKFNATIPCIVIGLTVTALAIQRRSFSLWGKAALALLVPILVLDGWWFVRNVSLYGDPLGLSVYETLFAVNARTDALSMQDVRHFATTQFNSFWGLFGWMTVWAPAWFYAGMRLFAVFCTAGLIIFLWRYWRTLSSVQKQALFFLAGAIVAQELFMLWSITRFNESWYQGRYLFLIIGPLMLLASLGIAGWVSKGMGWAAPVIGIGFLVLALFMSVATIRPAYASVSLPKSVAWTLPHRSESVWGEGMMGLRGYRVTIDPMTNTMDVTLYWQALRRPDFNYSAFVHLLDQAGNVIAQKDHAPGEEWGYPPLVWRPEDIIADHHVLRLPTTGVPTDAQLRIGLYNWETGEQLPVTTGGESTATYLLVPAQ